MKKITLLLAFFVIAALGAGCANTPAQPAPSPEAALSPEPAGETTPAPTMAAESASPATEGAVILYFANADATAVAPEARTLDIPEGIDLADYVRLLVGELIKGPQSEGLRPTIPPSVTILDVSVEGTAAHIDFSGQMLSEHSRGAAGEAMTIYSIVSTLTELEGIEGVMMTVEGQPMNIEHMVIDAPVTRNEGMIQK